MVAFITAGCGSDSPEDQAGNDGSNIDPGNFSRVRIHSNVQNGLGLQGYDPVSYQNPGIPQKGNSGITASYDDITYHFSNEANKEVFEADPERYVPAYGGWCATGMAFELINANWPSGKYQIDPMTFKVLDQKTYLFYNFPDYNALPDWNSQESRLKAFADDFWDNLIN